MKEITILIKSITILVAITILLNPNDLIAQGGSNYSIFGIGDIIYGNSAASQALGGTQIAVPSTNTINMLNPALWGMVKSTRIQTGYHFNQNIINNDKSLLWQNNGSINGFYSLFNFSPEKEISAAVFWQPTTSVNYYVSSPVNITNEDISLTGKKVYRGSGGLSNITLGLGGKVVNGIYIGASTSATIGRIANSMSTDYTSRYTDNYQINQTNIFSAFAFSGGVFITPVSNLSFGAFYYHSNPAGVEQRNEYLYLPSSVINTDTIIVQNMGANLPSYWGVGTSYQIKQILFAVDYLNGNFSDLQLNRPLDFGSALTNSFNNMQKISFGATLLGNPNLYATLMDRASYKFGAYYQNLYYNVNSQAIKEYALSFGAQYFISNAAQIDFSFIFGSRGTLKNGLLQETFGRLCIDVSIGDNWFRPARQPY